MIIRLHSTSTTFFGIGHARLGNAVDVHTGFLRIGSAYPFLSETAQGAHFISPGICLSLSSGNFLY
jgi:hypothetical protein